MLLKSSTFVTYDLTAVYNICDDADDEKIPRSNKVGLMLSPDAFLGDVRFSNDHLDKNYKIKGIEETRGSFALDLRNSFLEDDKKQLTGQPSTMKCLYFILCRLLASPMLLLILKSASCTHY